MKKIVFIPARYASSRLPQKSLAKVGDETLIEHIYKRCEKSELADAIYVLTDHEKIFKEVQKFTKNVLMTNINHKSGTDRVCEGAEILGLDDEDFVINVQGDQGLMDATLIDELIGHYEASKNKSDMFTFMNKLKDKSSINNTSEVKVIFNKDNQAIYFSRFAIPFNRDNIPIENIDYYVHLGIYGYSFGFLKKFVQMPESFLENMEKLEQLRVIENGYKIYMIKTDKFTIEVDFQEDIETLKKAMNRKII